MAVIDLPLSALKTYTGKNPCPPDFDAYWQAGLAQMNATDLHVEIRPADFTCGFADCRDLYFTGVGNARIYAKLITPRGQRHCPTLLCFHGYTGASSEWTRYLPYAAQGFAVAAMDCRGQGGRSQDRTQTGGTTFHGHIIRGLDDGPENLAFRQIFLDTAMLARVMMDLPETDPDRLMAMGGSQGGALTLACAALVPQIKKAAPVYPFLCDYQRVWELDLCTGAYIELRDYFRTFDPTHERETEIFTRLGYIDIQHLVKWIRAEVLMGVGLRDDICPPSTQFAAYNRMTCPKEMILYPDFTHETLPGLADKTFQWLTA